MKMRITQGQGSLFGHARTMGAVRATYDTYSATAGGKPRPSVLCPPREEKPVLGQAMTSSGQRGSVCKTPLLLLLRPLLHLTCAKKGGTELSESMRMTKTTITTITCAHRASTYASYICF